MAAKVDPTALPERRVTELVAQTERVVGKELGEVSVSFVTAPEIATLNRRYRNRSGPTDVLSFPFDGSFPQGGGGEVVVCPERADPATPAELERLVVHGTLHLLGYRDDTPEQLAEMESLTDTVLEAARG